MNRGTRTMSRQKGLRISMENQAITPETTETAAVADQGANVAPERASSTKKAKAKKGATKAAKSAKKASPKKQAKAAASRTAKSAKPASKDASKAAAPREGSKKETVIAMMRRKDGATLSEIAAATGWQNHSIRGFVSGQLTKRMGLAVESAKNASRERTYKIAK